MGFGSFFKKVLGGGGSGASATATAQNKIDFKPTTNVSVNFDTEGLKNGFIDGSNLIAGAFSNATQSQINFDREANKANLKQEETFFLQNYEQNENEIKNFNTVEQNKMALEVAGKNAELEQNAAQFNTLLEIKEKDKKLIVGAFLLGASYYIIKGKK